MTLDREWVMVPRRLRSDLRVHYDQMLRVEAGRVELRDGSTVRLPEPLAVQLRALLDDVTADAVALPGVGRACGGVDGGVGGASCAASCPIAAQSVSEWSGEP